MTYPNPAQYLDQKQKLAGSKNRIGGSTSPGGSDNTNTPSGGTDDNTNPLYDESAYTVLTALLQSWDLQSLAPTVLQLLQEGYTTDAIPVLLQDTDAYKKRFAGNEERKKAGLPVLSPGEYLATEKSYRNIMQAAGLPKGFYDDYSDFAGFISRDVSPVEVQRRVDAAITASNNVDQTWLDQFQSFYGVGRDQLAAYFLDSDRGMDVINKSLRGTTIATAARERGVGVDQSMAERFGAAADGNGYQQQANQFSQYASIGGKLGQIHNQTYTTEMAGEQVFSGNVTYADILKKLANQEEEEFRQGSGVGSTALKGSNQY